MKYAISPADLKRVQELVRRPAKKAKASVSVSEALLKAVDSVAGKAGRSALIERAVRRYLSQLIRRQRHFSDLDRLNANADALKAESDTVLADQAAPDDDTPTIRIPV